MKTIRVLFFICIAGMIITGCKQSTKRAEMMADEFIRSFEAEMIPVYIDMNKAYWDASISGRDEDYERSSGLEFKYSKILADREKFKKVKKFRSSGEIEDSLINRTLDILYNSMIKYQADTVKLEKLIKAQTELGQKFSTFRAEVNGKKLSDNYIEEILRNAADSKILEETWLASKQIGAAVAEDVIALVRLRNEIASDLGYSNFHEMSLRITDQDPEEVMKIFDELDSLTKGTFAELKEEMDIFLSEKYHVKKEDLMPWHYQNRFFQEAPQIYEVDLDHYYKEKDIPDIVEKFYAGIGLEVEDILENSDLYEKEGKNQHAYCTSIDRAGDVRILVNMKDNYQWTNTILHELGHAVYDKYIDPALPFTLREPAHMFTTEAIANFFGMLASNFRWMRKNLDIPSEDAEIIAVDVSNFTKLEKIVFSRWCQVMFRFEKSMYENPDQDLNKLWWDLAEQYQLLRCPEGRDNPDWASKIHIATFPCYYHNYLLGDLLAMQLDAYMEENIIGHKDPCYTGHTEVGDYLKEKIFRPGNRYYWNEMIERATGEKLTAKYYARQFIN
ncbi:MAG: M2 family metallopeptidase [Bacteroidales bacterium]|nr:M2 family metallopeptidase [Bacteroidales bacterium]